MDCYYDDKRPIPPDRVDSDRCLHNIDCAIRGFQADELATVREMLDGPRTPVAEPTGADTHDWMKQIEYWIPYLTVEDRELLRGLLDTADQNGNTTP